MTTEAIQGVFRAHTAPTRTAVDKLFARPRPDLALEAFEDLCARSTTNGPSSGAVEEIVLSYHLPADQADKVRRTFWRSAYERILSAGLWERGGADYLERLRAPFNIGEDEVIDAENALLLPYFEALVKQALSEPNILRFKMSDFFQRAQSLGINANSARKILQDAASNAFTRESNSLSMKSTPEGTSRLRRMSAEEIQRLDQIADIAGRLDETLKKRLDAERRYLMLLQTGHVEPIPVDVKLGKNEACFLTCHANWLTKGRGRNAGLERVDEGDFYITNFRLLFAGGTQTLSLKYEALLDVEAWYDAVNVKRSSGKSVVFEVPVEIAFLAGGIAFGIWDKARTSGPQPVQAPTTTAGAPQAPTHDQPMTMSGSAPANGKEPERKTDDAAVAKVLGELSALVGLAPVKAEVTSLVNLVKIQAMRLKQNLPAPSISFHLVFTGSPGTGKTTVARLIARVFAALGILSKGHLVEADRSGLVGGYVGQTALKTAEVVKSALGGVLFIDEAYALSDRGDHDFGQEAIETLLKYMEDHREDLVVIVAGYSSRMDAFLASNPGLRSRFSRTIEFPDYSPDELVEVLLRLGSAAQYNLSPEALAAAKALFGIRKASDGVEFGNARLARNLFERAVANQANRISANASPTRDDLCVIEPADLPSQSELTG